MIFSKSNTEKRGWICVLKAAKFFSVENVVISMLCTVMILINATTLMHKSTLITNNFGNNHFGQKYQKQNILGNFRRL